MPAQAARPSPRPIGSFPSWCRSQAAEARFKLYSGGHPLQLSALPVLTDLNVRCAPVLESHTG
ncbi:MAG: hypothetical protein EOS63_28270 [Mesorhizobium sp.]|nr:MAG: hypothetical protein EOS63_28270 [Mesorhizobium sp.]TIT07831.1 MAG: NAD-glutamate dehydrogenase [Mesorhizobium sp.]TJW60156.1 MAG: NAD-glutamate dehydrogenase [Mesorhizobium sp.]